MPPSKPERRLLAASLLLLPLVAGAGPRFSVCYDFGCAVRAEIALLDHEWGAIIAPLQARAADSDGERARLAEAVARFEQVVGRYTPTSADRGGSNYRAPEESGQMDCIDESTNTTTYLRLLAEAGLLRWHEVDEIAVRQRWLFAFHRSAVIRELDSGERFVVDSWAHDNGEPPLIQSLRAWD
ncbi:MAG TPA: hypothetical protein VIW02_03915 [Gammaproteobacteria bacterium]